MRLDVDEPQASASAESTSSSSRPSRGLQRTVIVVVVATVLYVGWHGAIRGWELQRRFVCGQNMKGVGAAMQVYYGKEWNGRTSFIEWMESAYPVSREWLKCPSGGAYHAVEFLNGWPTNDDAVIAYEPKSNHKEEGGFVANRHGVVRFVPVPEYDQLIEPLEVSRRKTTP